MLIYRTMFKNLTLHQKMLLKNGTKVQFCSEITNTIDTDNTIISKNDTILSKH